MMTNSNQSNTPENPSTLLNSSGTLNQQTAPSGAEPKELSINNQSADSNIMGGATMSDEGHTAIKGLENRKVFVRQRADLSGISDEAREAIARINALNAKKRAKAMQPSAPQPALAPAAASEPATGASIMGGATVTDEGHTAIMGLENRTVPQHKSETSTLITGINAQDLATIEHINEINARKRSIRAQAEAQFRAEIAAERAQKEAGLNDDAPGYITPHSHEQELDKLRAESQAEAQKAVQAEAAAVAAANAAAAASVLSGIVADPTAQESSDWASELEGGVGGPSAQWEQEEAQVSTESAMNYSGDMGQESGAFSAQDSDADYGGNFGSALDDESVPPQLNSDLNAGVFAGTEPDDFMSGRNLSLSSGAEAVPNIGVIEQVSGKSLMKDDMPDLSTKLVVDEQPDDFAKEQMAPEQEVVAADTYPKSGADTSLVDQAFAAPSGAQSVTAPDAPVWEESSPYITPGAARPEVALEPEYESPYRVGPNPNESYASTVEPVYSVGPRVSSQERAMAAQAEPAYSVGPRVSSQERAMAAQAEPAYSVGPRVSSQEQAMAAQAEPNYRVGPNDAAPMGAMAPESYVSGAQEGLSDELLDESGLKRAPAGMGDGPLSLLPSQEHEAGYADGPHYVIGPSRRHSARSDESAAAPLYAIGVGGATNAEVESRIQQTRSQLADRALPHSYLDEVHQGEGGLDEAYEQDLLAAARESMVRPHNEEAGAAPAAKTVTSKEAAPEQAPAPEVAPAYEEQLPPRAEPVSAADKAQYGEGYAQEPSYAQEQPYAQEQQYTQEQYAESEPLSQEQAAAVAAPVATESAELAAVPRTEHVKPSMALFLFMRQLVASLFTHTTLPVVAPHLALRLGPCYPSSMAVPFLIVGLIVGALGAVIKDYTPLQQMAGITTCLIFLLLTGLSPYRGIYRIFTFITRRRHDAVMMASSVMVSLFFFIGLSSSLIQICSGVGEISLAFALAAMLSAATASTLTWHFPQDPMDSCGSMTTKGLVFVIVLCALVAFGLLNYAVAASLFGVGIVMRIIFGYCIAKNQGTAQRPYVGALQLLTLFALLLDLVLLKSQGYALLNNEILTWLAQYDLSLGAQA